MTWIQPITVLIRVCMTVKDKRNTRPVLTLTVTLTLM